MTLVPEINVPERTDQNPFNSKLIGTTFVPIALRALGRLSKMRVRIVLSLIISSIVIFLPVLTTVSLKKGEEWGTIVIQSVSGFVSARAMVRVRVAMMTLICLLLVLRRSFLQP